MTPQQQKQQQPQRPPRLPVFGRTWWLIMLGLLIWNIWMYWPAGKPIAGIPYTTFLTQVRANNVARVHIVGDQITGTFAHAITWPQTAPGAAPAATPPSYQRDSRRPRLPSRCSTRPSARPSRRQWAILG